MKYPSIKRHLKSYSIASRRSTTINHAFAAAIAPFDAYNEEKIQAALKILGQSPDDDLRCAYCGRLAETWDHIFATVRDREFSGYGHRISNLLPCCKNCNSRKGNKNWERHLNSLGLSSDETSLAREKISRYIGTGKVDEIPCNLPEYKELQAIRDEVLVLFRRADALAESIRKKSGPA